MKIEDFSELQVKIKQALPVNMLASSRSTRVPSLVEIQVKCKGSTSRSPVRAVKLPSAAAQLFTFPFPAKEKKTTKIQTLPLSILFKTNADFMQLIST